MAAGADQKSGTSAAPQQPPGQQASAADAPHATPSGPAASSASPSASSASLRPSSAQMPGPGSPSQQQQQQYGSPGMPLGAVDMSRAAGAAPALADDSRAANGLVRP